MSKRLAKGILTVIGNTPVVELERLYPDHPGRIFAKLESFNPGGSVKDRPALSLMLEGIRGGDLVPGRSVVVESSSGNLAIGLAQVCRYLGLSFVCVVDAKTTEQNRTILSAYGATVEVVSEPDPATGEYLPARIRRVQEIVAGGPEYYWPDQYSNPLNPLAHQETMREITEALDGRVDYVFCATGSCGTLRGCSGYIREQGLATRVVAVDAVGSVLFGDEPRPRLVPGHGSSIRPALLDESAADLVVRASDLECVVGCRRLIAREAVFAGGSSGAIVSALVRLREEIPAGARCALILPDGGDRYLDTIYSDAWVRRYFGEVSHLWKDGAGDRLPFRDVRTNEFDNGGEREGTHVW